MALLEAHTQSPAPYVVTLVGNVEMKCVEKTKALAESNWELPIKLRGRNFLDNISTLFPCCWMNATVAMELVMTIMTLCSVLEKNKIRRKL